MSVGHHDELAFVESRRGVGNRLGFALQLKHYQLYARFINGDREVPVEVAEYLLDQLVDRATPLVAYDWTGRSGRRHRQEILQFLSVRPFDSEAEAHLLTWLINEVLPTAPKISHLVPVCLLATGPALSVTRFPLPAKAGIQAIPL